MAAPADDQLASLLDRAARGDEDAWREIVEAYAPRVFGLIRANCDDAELAEEITQSAFCTVAAKIGDYADSGRFEAWIFRIAMNRLRDEMRRRRRHARPVDHPTLSGLAGAAATRRDPPDESLRRRLESALAQLPDADREIIHLRHFGELSFRRIAEIRDEPLGTVLARHHRALKKLAAMLPPDLARSLEG